MPRVYMRVDSIPPEVELPQFLEEYTQFYPISDEAERVAVMTKAYEKLSKEAETRSSKLKASEDKEAQKDRAAAEDTGSDKKGKKR